MISAFLFALVLVVAGSTVGYSTYYRDRALPGTSVAGLSVAGMSRAEVLSHVTQAAKDVSVAVDVDGQVSELGLDQAGYVVNAEATVERVFSANQSWWSRLTSIGQSRQVEPAVEVNETRLDNLRDELASKAGEPAQNATVKFDENQQRFVAQAERPGKGVDTHTLQNAFACAARTLNSQELSLQVLDVEPQVTTARAQAVAEEANQYLDLKITITDGIRDYSPDADTRASWMNLSSADGELTDPTINAEAVTQWVSELGKETNEDPVPGIRNVNSRGDVVSTPSSGSKGYTVKNIDEVATALIKALNEKTNFTGDFDYDETEPTYETRLIADGAENLVYQAAPGEKWIDINLSNNTVTAYEGSTIMQGPMYMVPGAPGMETVTGTFRVYLKYASQTMRGFNLDGSRYETPDVPWVTYFHGDYALHGAPWRSSFGWSGEGGSHGCVNMPVANAQWIYNWADIGTVVVSHY